MGSLGVVIGNRSDPWVSSSTTEAGPTSIGECHNVHNYNHSLQCDFVRGTPGCDIDDGIVNYTQMIYCNFGSTLTSLAIFVLILWLGFLFIAMAVCADGFFCPPLVVMAKLFNMSDNVAGVTILAFGNGANDVFSSITAMNSLNTGGIDLALGALLEGVTLLALGNGAADVFSAIAAINSSKNGDIGLAMGALLGAGMFITTLIPGAISFMKEIRVSQRPILRDIIFFIAAVYLTFVVLFSRKITLGVSIAFFCIYILYVLVVVFGRFIYQRNRSSSPNYESVLPETAAEEEPSSPDIVPSTTEPESEDGSVVNRQDEDSEFTPLLGHRTSEPSGWKELLVTIIPLDLQGYKASRWYVKTYLIVQAPSLFILQLFIPLMDYSRPKNGWCRYLNVMQCVTAPLVALLIAKPKLFTHCIGGHFPVFVLVLIIGVIMAVVVFMTSTNEQPPVYHPLFAVLGFAAAVVWTEFLATEIVNILQTFGVTFNISDAILGLTLLAWGNSLGDLVADIAIARKGFHRTAIAACYGGPLFNLLLGVGIPFTIRTISEGTIELQFTLLQIVLLTSLLFHLVVTLFVLLGTKFTINRGFGIYSFIFYIVFMVMSLLVEENVITANLM